MEPNDRLNTFLRRIVVKGISCKGRSLIVKQAIIIQLKLKAKFFHYFKTSKTKTIHNPGIFSLSLIAARLQLTVFYSLKNISTLINKVL